MAADDLEGVEAIYLSCAGVPTRHLPIRIQHENGVVADALDERAQSRFVDAQAFFVLASLGDITRHLRIADELATAVTQRRDHHIRPEPAAVLAYPPAFVFEAAFTRRHDELS